LKRQGGNAAVENTVRQLKTEQARSKGAVSNSYEPSREPSRKIPRSTNIFKR
jgi:hypothetical protein